MYTRLYVPLFANGNCYHMSFTTNLDSTKVKFFINSLKITEKESTYNA